MLLEVAAFVLSVFGIEPAKDQLRKTQQVIGHREASTLNYQCREELAVAELQYITQEDYKIDCLNDREDVVRVFNDQLVKVRHRKE